MARRAASIWRAVSQPHSTACRPKSPKLRSVPPAAGPFMRPLNCFLCLTLFGINMTHQLLLTILLQLVTVKNFALEDQDFDTNDAVSRLRFGKAVVDVGAQGVQRHAAFAIPLAAAHLRTAQTPGAFD